MFELSVDLGLRAALSGGITNFEFMQMVDVCAGDAAATVALPEKELASLLGRSRAKRWATMEPDTVARERERCADLGIELLLLGAPSFPAELACLAEAPLLLYTMGGGELTFQRSVSIVGSRRCSRYGRENAHSIAAELARQGAVVLSGLARGIDTAGHRGALEGGGATVAVMGRGLAEIYPAENRGLAREIVESGRGLLISEYPLDAPPRSYHFPRRNRLISALSRAVAVIEGGMRSGTLSTVNWALDQGREVFALPGPVDMPGSALAHHLIRDGAQLLRRAEDIVESFADWQFQEFEEYAVELPDDKLGAAICSLLREGPTQVEEILSVLSESRADTLARLTLLEIDRVVRKEAGNTYRLDSRLKS